MKLQEWREKQNRVVELPSGLTVTVRPVALAELAARGKIPTPMVSLVNEMLAGTMQTTIATVQDFEQYGGLVDLVAMASVVDPPIAEHGDETHLGVDELNINDKTVIFNLLHGESAALQPFRGESAVAVGAALPGDGVRATAEWDPADQ